MQLKKLGYERHKTDDLQIELEDGYAECMGDGLFILFQPTPEGDTQSLVLTRRDMVRMLQFRG